MAAFTIFNGLLTDVFQPSQPIDLAGEHLVLDSTIIVANTVTPPATAAEIQFYFEYTSADPNAAATTWYRETTEEDIGNGDVRMNKAVRRFSEQGADLPLAVGTHNLNMQFNRKHAYARMQIRRTAASADTCRATVLSIFGRQPVSPA